MVLVMHYQEKLDLRDDEIVALKNWVGSQLKDVDGYLKGLRTNFTEAFHSLSNKYYRKGVPLSFCHYKLRKSLAVLHWN